MSSEEDHGGSSLGGFLDDVDSFLDDVDSNVSVGGLSGLQSEQDSLQAYDRRKSRPDDYNFLKCFGLTGLLFNKSISADKILDTLKSSLGERDIRRIINEGISSLRNKSHDSSITNTLYDVFSQQQQQPNQPLEPVQDTTPPTNKTYGSRSDCRESSVEGAGEQKSARDCFKYRSRALGITSIVCNVFIHLDFECKQVCKLVSSDWLKSAYQKESHSVLDLRDMIQMRFVKIRHWKHDKHINDNKNSMRIRRSIKDLSRFGNIKSLNLIQWAWPYRCPIAECFHLLPSSIKADQIEKVCVKISCKDGAATELDENYGSVVVDLLKKQTGSIKDIQIEGMETLGFSYSNSLVQFGSPHIISFFDEAKEINCFALEKLDIRLLELANFEAFESVASALIGIGQNSQNGCEIRIKAVVCKLDTASSIVKPIPLIWQLCTADIDVEGEFLFDTLGGRDVIMRWGNEMKRLNLIRGQTGKVQWRQEPSEDEDCSQGIWYRSLDLSRHLVVDVHNRRILVSERLGTQHINVRIDWIGSLTPSEISAKCIVLE